MLNNPKGLIKPNKEKRMKGKAWYLRQKMQERIWYLFYEIIDMIFRIVSFPILIIYRIVFIFTGTDAVEEKKWWVCPYIFLNYIEVKISLKIMELDDV